MKSLIVAAGLIAMTAGAARPMPSPPSRTVPAARGTESGQYVSAALLWRESSGPHGERNPVALPLYEAVFAHDKQQVAVLLDRGASPNALLYPGGWSPLMVAIAYNDHPIAQLLVKRGADVNYISKDPATGTPLAVALSFGRFYPMGNPDFSMLHYLLNSGADINVEFHGSDIAIYAVTVGQMAIVNELLARGYHHNLPKLKKWLEIRRADDKNQFDKEKALATVDRLLMH